MPRLLHPFPPPLLSSKQSWRAEIAHDVKSRKPPWSLPSPISAQLSRCDRAKAAAHSQQGEQAALTGPREPNPGGHPSTPTTTKSLICISNASQMGHLFSFQLLPLKTISLKGLKFLVLKTTHSPASPKHLSSPSRQGHSTWGLHGSRPPLLPYPSSTFCSLSQALSQL